MGKGNKQSFNKLGMFSFATFYTGEYKKEGMTYEKIFEKWKHSRINFEDSLSIAKLSQTPITPESLEGIGFKETTIKGQFKFILNAKRPIFCIYYEINSGKSYTWGGDLDLYFTSTEQIQEWIKPFTKGEGNG